MKYNTNKYFPCYSLPLKDFLINNGFEIYVQFVHIKTNKTCFLFHKSDELDKFLQIWTDRREEYLKNKEISIDT